MSFIDICGDLPIGDLKIPVIIVAVCMVIIFIFIKEYIDLSNERKPLKKSLESTNTFLNQYSKELNHIQYKELNDFFDSDPLLKNQWNEFSETIIDTDVDGEMVFNTEQVENYFNREAVIDLNIHTNHFSTMPGVLTGLGLLGTFVSILIGLSHVHIEGNQVTGINPLINGLSGKFISSIIGLTTSIVFNYYYNGVVRELENLTYSLQHKINGLFARNLSEKSIIKIATTLEKIYSELSKEKKTNDANDFDENLIIDLSEQIKGFRSDVKDDIQKTLTTLGNINKEIIENLTEQFKNLRTESRDSNEQIIKILDENFKLTNSRLDEAVKTLAKGATEEIIKALQQVIKDFNDNLTEQFGENFKELNNAVFKLVDWQENYKSSIQEIEKGLKTSINTLNSVDGTLESISSRNTEVMNVYEQLKIIINTHNSQLELINQRLDDYSKLNVEVQKIIETVKDSFSNSVKEFNRSSSDVLDTIMDSHDNMYKSFEVSSKSILDDTQKHIKANSEEINSNLKATLDELNKLSEKIQISLSNQSESLSKLSSTLPEHSQVLNTRLASASDEIEKQLTESLGQMERALVALTNKFRDTYDATLKNQAVKQ